LVIETSRPIAQVAKELGIVEGTLGNWVNAYCREHAGEEPPLAIPNGRSWQSCGDALASLSRRICS
jgi:transposase-like protein